MTIWFYDSREDSVQKNGIGTGEEREARAIVLEPVAAAGRRDL